jgi:hypothetical protein
MGNWTSTGHVGRTLNEAGKKAFHEELTTLWTRNNTATDGTTMLSGEYIEVIGTRS